MKVIAYIKRFLEMDKYVSGTRQREILRTQRIIALIASVGFLIFTVINKTINVKQEDGADYMFIATLGGSIALALAFGISYLTKNTMPLLIGFYAVLGVMLPIFVLTAGNDGFAALWIVLVTYIAMHAIDFRAGFIFNVYFFVLLALIFWCPPVGNALFLNDEAREIYGDQFLTRFPFFDLINFAFATYIVGSIRVYQYRLLMHQKKLEDLSVRDLSTDLYNRNAYIEFCKKNIVKPGESVAVIYMDANGLHELNNAEGHAAGDLLLKTVADTSKAIFGNENCYRVGGDEFVACVLGITREDAEERTRRIVEEGDVKGYSVSAGLVWTNKRTDLNEITADANTLMLQNKADYYTQKEKDRRRNRTVVSAPLEKE